MKTYPARPASIVTSCSSSSFRRSLRQRSSVHTRSAWQPFRDEQLIFGVGEGQLDPGGLDNREIATILRRALMDLVVAFQAIERQVHGGPDRRHTTSNRG